MCANIIINGTEYDDFGDTCTCGMTWPEIMEFIGQHTERLGITEQLVICRDPFDFIVTYEKIEPSLPDDYNDTEQEFGGKEWP